MSRLECVKTDVFRKLQVKLCAALVALCTATATTNAAPIAVTTFHNDNARSGANLRETILNTSNVKARQFGKLFEQAVDDDIYGQVLYVSGVSIPDKGIHNVVYVATQSDSVYAFDAESNSGANADPLWQANFTDPSNGITAIPVRLIEEPGEHNLRPGGNVGIMGTPVIDLNTKTMYLVARTYEQSRFVQKLHALDIGTGAEKFGGPVTIRARVDGTGNASANGILKFNSEIHNQRAGLALGNGAVYISWASHRDFRPYHGWMMAYDARTLKRLSAFAVTPNGFQGGIWQAGQPPIIDASGNVVVATGNGSNNALTLGTDYGQSVLRLTPRTLQVADWFSPDTWELFNVSDLDLNSAGPMLIPDRNRIISAGKDGQIYVLNSANLGRLSTGNVNAVQVLNSNTAQFLYGSPVYYRSPTVGRMIYFWPPNEALKAYTFNGSRLGNAPAMETRVATNVSFPGGFLSVSANAAKRGTGIVWASLPLNEEAISKISPGVLRAFDASDLTKELWNSAMRPNRDAVGNFAKFVPPTIARGRVYVPTFSSKLLVYGLLNPTAYQFATLRTTVDGTRSGSVVNSLTGTECRTICAERINVGKRLSLTAIPDSGGSFDRWAGACKNKPNPCQLRFGEAATVRAIFR